MKWFKHLTNAHKGNSLQDLYAEFGINEGHGLYFRLVEFLADKWDGKSDPRFRFLTEILRSHMALPPKKFNIFVEILERDASNAISLYGKFIEIYFPKLLEVRHRDSLDASTRLELRQHKNGGEENKNKNKSIPTEDQLRWFTELSKKYVASFLNTTIGTKSKKRFCDQIQTEEQRSELALAIEHYKTALDFDNKDRNWRSPKKTFETFLGTEKSGYFWRDHIAKPNLPQAPMKVVL